MEEMIGYCGYNCGGCAARSDDPALRQKLVDGWRKLFGHEMYTAENVRCNGCRGDGLLADKSCKARPCAQKKGVDSCAACDEFACDRVRHLLGSRETLMLFCIAGNPDVTEEEYNLCARQFEGMPNLIKAMVKTGKLPAWAGEETVQDVQDDGRSGRSGSSS
jgi:hypothetical protein